MRQIHQYADDYQKRVAYLVIYNLTTGVLHLPTDGPEGH